MWTYSRFLIGYVHPFWNAIVHSAGKHVGCRPNVFKNLGQICLEGLWMLL